MEALELRKEDRKSMSVFVELLWDPGLLGTSIVSRISCYYEPS